jgi:ABC-type antimicrobial peptide transport system permease subunit
MYETYFPVNDVFRRKLQTSLTVISLTCSVASTLFLLLFSTRIGVGATSTGGETLTRGLSIVLSQFLWFVGILIFIVGAVLTSFIVFLLMVQRTQDFGLIKAVGCPNGLVFGYFMTELLIVTSIGCVIGIVFGFTADYVISNMGGLYQRTPNFWFAPLVFAAFFSLALIFGTKPILNAARMSPMKALSTVNYFGLSMEKKHKPLSKRGITWRIATRSLFRRQSASIRIIILLSTVFVLLTVSIAGGIIASDTTKSWIAKAADKNTIAIAHESMGVQYKMLMSRFSGGAEENDVFNYMDPKLGISDALIQQLNSVPGVVAVDKRLVFEDHVYERSNFTIDPETLATYPVGDSREGDSLIVGVDPQKVTSEWSTQGRLMSSDDVFEAVVGDTIAQDMFSPNPGKNIRLSNPLVQGITLQNTSFSIVGVCVDPINNGRVTYVPIEKLRQITKRFDSNIVFLKLDSSTDRAATEAEIKTKISVANADLEIFELNQVVEDNISFLSSTWSTIMLLPLLTLTSATLCLIGYAMLVVDEQHQEFAILRAIGGKPRLVISIVAYQSLIVLLSGFAFGISFGIMTTLLILMSHPLVTSFTVIEIAAWLIVSLGGMFLFSLYPAFKLAKTPILKIMS